MLNSLFHWFYCLTIPQALLIMAVFTGMFLFLRHKLEKRRLWKPALVALLLCWGSAVAVQTIFARGSEVGQEASLIPFQSYVDVWNGGNPETYRSNLMNVLLFYPAGLFAICLWTGAQGTKRRSILLTALFALLSIGIECSQYCFALGYSQTDDVIHNTLGAFLGILVGCLYEKHAVRWFVLD